MKKFLIAFLLIPALVLHSFASAGKKEIILRLTEPSTFVFDETIIYLDLGSPQFMYAEDGQKVLDDSSAAPMLFSFTSDQVSCFSNCYGNLVPATIVPLGLRVAGNGTYIISASLIDNFDPTSVLLLEDRALAVVHDLRQGNYTFTINQATQNDSRFFLHVSAPPVITTTIAGCNNNDGVIAVAQDTSIRWTSSTLYDNSFNMIASFQSVTGNFSFGGLAFGNYNLVFARASYSAIKQVQLDGKSVAVGVTASTTHTTVGQPVQFFAAATNATNYLWDFGEGSQITGVVNPTFSYIQPGVYDASIHCSNVFGCSAIADITIIVDEATSVAPLTEENISVTIQNKSLQVMFNKLIDNNYNFQLFNSVGQQLISNVLNSGENIFYLSNLPTGVYIARISNEHSAFSKKIVLQ